jgi:hypothetical protein
LFATFAPVWEVDVAGRSDRIGRPAWTKCGTPVLDVGDPKVYRRLSPTWFNGRVLLQLNYQIWFPARPRSGALDLLGGHMDGLTWRVTLASDGHPLLFDAIHNCGCYHMFFPSRRLRLKPPPAGLVEPLLTPIAAPPWLAQRRIVLRLARSSHYIQDVRGEALSALPGTARNYRFDDYDALRSLPTPRNSARGLFCSDGIVVGTERRERWIL